MAHGCSKHSSHWGLHNTYAIESANVYHMSKISNDKINSKEDLPTLDTQVIREAKATAVFSKKKSIQILFFKGFL